MKILTIDMDYILENDNFDARWGDLQYKINNDIRLTLLNFISKLKFTKSYVITEHQEIVSIISTYNDIYLYNIDMHHDIYYNESLNDLDCGNWVYKTKDLLKEYYWIKNPKSEIFIQKPDKPSMDYNIIDSLDKIPTQYDIVVLCSSIPDYFPFQEQKYFDEIKAILESREDKNIQNNNLII